MPPSEAASRQDQLAKSLADYAVAAIKPLIDDHKKGSAAEFAKMTVTLTAILTRLETLEVAAASGTKRAVRTGAARGGTATPRARGGATAGIDWNKVKNSMLFCRAMWATAAEFRTEFGGNSDETETQRIKGILAADDGVAKKDTEESRLLAEGTVLWKKVLTDTQKKVVRDRFDQWRKQDEAEAMQPPLGADEGSAESDGVEA